MDKISKLTELVRIYKSLYHLVTVGSEDSKLISGLEEQALLFEKELELVIK